jgi:hypothetical protein
MENARVPSSDDLYAASLVSGQAYICRFMQRCLVTGVRRVCVVLPADAMHLPMDTIVEDAHTKIRVRVGLLVRMAAHGLVTPVFTASAFHAYTLPAVVM